MTKRYKDSYGCRSTMEQLPNGKCRMKTWTGNGKLIVDRIYNTERGAKVALSRHSDGTAREIDGQGK